MSAWHGNNGAFMWMRALVLAAALTTGLVHSAGADDGAAVYGDHCLSCHGSDLKGAAGPALIGPGFMSPWHDKAGDLYNSISQTMPLDSPRSLTSSQYHAVVDYILARNVGNVGPDTKKDVNPYTHDDADEARLPTPGRALPASFPDKPQVFAAPTSSGPGDAELMDNAGTDWLHYNRDYEGQRFSPLTQITPLNITKLVPKCILQIGEIGSFQSSPIVYKGRLFVTTAHWVYALDAATCRKLWSYHYRSSAREGLPTNRGVALYKGMVLRGTIDGHMIAIDAMTGKLLWDIWVCDSDKGCFISGVPVVFDNKIFVGEAGADVEVSAKVEAFDAASGRHLWTFHVVPEKGEPGFETWGRGRELGGGSMWTTITVEPSSKRLYVSTGNPGRDLDARDRPGTDLFTDSVVVLDAETGKLQWSVQQVPGDEHDWDTAAAPVLYNEQGKPFIAVASKNARLYIYNRDSHALVATADLARHLNENLPLSSDHGIHVCPGIVGGVEWNGPAYDPLNHIVFVNSVDWCDTLEREHIGTTGNPLGGALVMDPVSEAGGWLRAFDSATGKQLWAYKASAPMLAGVTPTASGLMLTGTGDGEFLAFDSKSGSKLYSFYTGGAIAGGPSTYMLNGHQYVAVASGNNSKSLWQVGGAATVIVFGLP